MKILEFGDKKKKKLVLIHGLECPYQIFDEYINYYQVDFHVIVLILEGHYPNNNENFVSFEDSVNKFVDYYIPKYGKNIYAVYGMSLGGIIASKIWESQKFEITKLIIESGILFSCGLIMKWFLKINYLVLTHQIQKRNNIVIKKATDFINSKDKLNCFLKVSDNMLDKTLINYINEICHYKLTCNINNSSTKIYYLYGTKLNEILSKKSAKYIKKCYPSTKLVCFMGKNHCENLLIHSEVMIDYLNKLLCKK